MRKRVDGRDLGLGFFQAVEPRGVVFGVSDGGVM